MAESDGNYIGIDRGIDQRLLRMAAEPVRMKALVLLNERTAGASELAGDLGVSVAEAARHLEQMRDEGLIEATGDALGNGAIEPHYRAVVRMLWNDEEWAELGLAERRRLSAWIMQSINTDVCEALEAGTFDMRFDTHLSRQVSRVDERGWRELCRIHEQALEAIFAVEAASGERLAESGEEGLTVLSAMICGELPPRPTPGSPGPS